MKLLMCQVIYFFR